MEVAGEVEESLAWFTTLHLVVVKLNRVVGVKERVKVSRSSHQTTPFELKVY